jgi:N,N-dimethylformamidase beta subunit-like protein/uncharacterized protein DUF4082/Big-like domain-containing protein
MANEIVTENGLPGSPATQWDLGTAGGSSDIEGFATDISVNRGQTVHFKINTAATKYKIEIYRLGYYKGNGARLITTLTQTASSVQPAPGGNTSIGLVDAGNWRVTTSWLVPATAVSGVYLAHLVRTDGTTGANHIPFVVRDDATFHDIVFQTSDTTWHAYNGWGGYSLYGGDTAESDGRAYKVSYNRPIATRDRVGTYAGPQDFLFGEEIAAIHWLEANGYDVCYMAGLDTDRLDPTGKGLQIIKKRKVFLSVGHDEYWSGNQRANVEAARGAGVHLAFWSGNEVFWKTRYEASIVSTDGSPTAYRTLVCYKETRDDKKLDPLDPGTVTCTWRDPRFGSDAGKPENALTGTIFMVDDFREDQILIPFPMTKLRFWRNSAIAATPAGQSGSLVKHYLGYEWDESPDNGFRPPGLIRLSLTTLSVSTYLLDYGHLEGPGIATHSLTLYRHPSGAIVFGAGTVMWAWGLDPDHDPDPDDKVQTPVDPNVKQAMVNLLFDMGAFAGSLVKPLVNGSASSDHTPPSSTITFPASGASFPQNQGVTVTGTSSDVGGIVAGVEVSDDDGTTWHPVSTTSFNATSGSITGWTYIWSPVLTGSYKLVSRAIDDSLNIGAASAPVTVKVTASSGISLFSGATPLTVSVADPNAVELGVKFQSSQAGTISAIRFYKGPFNTGVHTAHLWTATGTLLASANFSAETASGWQQAALSPPVAITAGVLHVASYHTAGNYSGDTDYFASSAHTVGPLTAPAGANGVYTYGAGVVFPSSSFLGTNYFVDVVFNPGGTGGSQPPVAKDDSVTATQNTALPIAASTLLANDTDPRGLTLSVFSVTSGTHGTVTWNAAAKTVTFTPTTDFTGVASFTYIIKNSAGLSSAPATVAVSVNAPGGTTTTLFSADSTPGTITVNDQSAVELGVRFQSSVDGKIVGIRFYKGPQNLGLHTAHLWSSTGSLLGTATFAGETASGWQQANFATPVIIQPNTVYVASYYAPQGFYSADSNYFAAAHVSGHLTALASTSTAGNGVYAYSAISTFPASTFGATNYWVDVVFMS